MTAFIAWSDPLAVTIDRSVSGEGSNYADTRTAWFGLSSISFINGAFTMPAGTAVTGATWFRDSGPVTLAATSLEARCFCLKGKLTFSFTGTGLIARVNTDFAWGSGVIRIDGTAPSTMGLLTGIDSLSCNSADYGLPGSGYVDVVLADGLSNAAHTCTVSVNNTGSLFFSIAGFKVPTFTPLAVTHSSAWLVPASQVLAQNNVVVTVKNRGSHTVRQPSLAFPATLKSATGGALTTLSVPSLGPGISMSKTVLPDFTGAETTGPQTFNMTLAAQYQDAAGAISATTAVGASVGNSRLIVGGAGWSIDNATTTGAQRQFTSVLGSGASQNKITFTFSGNLLALLIQQDFGWGDFGLYAADNTTLLNTIPCSNGFQTLFTAILTGYGAGTRTVNLRKTTEDGKFVVFIAASWDETLNYTAVSETVPLVFQARPPIPYAVQDVVVSPTNVTFSAPVSAPIAVTADGMVRVNSDIAYTETLSRFPTYAVCYKSGFSDILSRYDIVIVDPFAVRASDVIAWRNQGILVFGYISFGEELGFFTNRYDFSPGATSPATGNATGPGGYAGYFNKAGNGSRECSECTFDNQAATGAKTCAQARPEYYTATGRCSAACTFDTRTGYVTQQAGGTCGAGFTIANFYQRSASVACTNVACPSYKPTHKVATNTLCPLYSQATGAYLQDFSVATPNFPDANGIWGSFFVNPDPTKGWLTRLNSYYAPLVLGEPVSVVRETVVVQSVTVGGVSRLAFPVAQTPVDGDLPITLQTADLATTYTKYVDFSFDPKTGSFLLSTTISPAVSAGQSMRISYVRKGLFCDGVFMDTVDTVDVYPATGFGTNMATLINGFKTANPNALLISNRGFTILPQIIGACRGVMFESWSTSYDFGTGVYSKVTDAPTIAFNTSLHDQLFALRLSHTFDVFSLNYCADDDLKLYCRQEDSKRGYLSWQSTIDLGNPASNTPAQTLGLPIATNEFVRVKRKDV